ncbi:MAG: hypothetical protein ACYTGL_22520 [Planctomycetota bacterium]|jgi:hypothetical protein
MSNYQVPEELAQTLAELRARIRRYVLIEGIALTVVALASLFWLSLLVDHTWFQVSRLELPYWFRAAFDVGVAGLAGFLLVSWVGLRVLRGFRAKALALVLERRFPELNDRLVTAVELSEASETTDSPLASAMLRQTVADAVEATQKLDLTSVFDRKPLQRAVTAAAVLIASIGGLAVASNSTIQTWKSSFLDLDDEYWNRECALTVRVVAQPGDLIRDFDDQSIKHPRGADLTLLIDVDEGRKVPDRVQLNYRLANGRGSGTVLCSKIGERQFRHSLSGLLDDVEFYIYGGDFVNREPYRVQIVEPPQLDQIELASFYPAYTGLAAPESTSETPLRDVVPVRGTQVELPNETEFLLTATSNKPIVRVRMQFGDQELVFARRGDDVSAEHVRRDDQGEVLHVEHPDSASASDWLSTDGLQIAVPFVLSPVETDAARARIDGLSTELGTPFVIAPESNLRIFLEDIDGILTAEPARVTVSGIVDQSPVVETRLRGIGTSITRKATIPVLGRIVDDYGMADVRFQYRVNDQEDWDRRELESGLPQAADGTLDVVREFTLQRNDEEEFERFDVVPLDLSLNQRLTLTVVAEDRDNLNGPHVTLGERYSFKIVSNEELTSLLYQRELNLRSQFERVITETKETQQDLIRHRARVDERKRLSQDAKDGDAASDAAEEAKTKLTEINLAVTACAERSLHQIRKNANETASVEQAFRDIREELVNNKLHTPQTLERIDDRIVKPLQSISETDYPAIDESLGLFRLANERGNDPTATIDQSVELLASMIKRMETVLAEMEKLKDFRKLGEELKELIEAQEALLDRTKKEQKKQFLKKNLGF